MTRIRFEEVDVTVEAEATADGQVSFCFIAKGITVRAVISRGDAQMIVGVFQRVVVDAKAAKARIGREPRP